MQRREPALECPPWNVLGVIQSASHREGCHLCQGVLWQIERREGCSDFKPVSLAPWTRAASSAWSLLWQIHAFHLLGYEQKRLSPEKQLHKIESRLVTIGMRAKSQKIARKGKEAMERAVRLCPFLY
jgi:hypothetical protein